MLMNQITVGHVNLDDFKICFECQTRRCRELRDRLVDVRLRHLPWDRGLVRKRKRTRCQRLPSTLIRSEGLLTPPWNIGGGFSSRVGKLDSGHGPLPLYECRDSFECFSVPVGPHSAVKWRNTT